MQKPYTAFFNTEPQLGSLVVGITALVWKKRVQTENAVNVKPSTVCVPERWDQSLSIDDLLVVGTLIPDSLGDCPWTLKR